VYQKRELPLLEILGHLLEGIFFMGLLKFNVVEQFLSFLFCMSLCSYKFPQHVVWRLQWSTQLSAPSGSFIWPLFTALLWSWMVSIPVLVKVKQNEISLWISVLDIGLFVFIFIIFFSGGFFSQVHYTCLLHAGLTDWTLRVIFL
jgi:hypothetical protein